MLKMFNMAFAGFLAGLGILAMSAEAKAEGISVELNNVLNNPDNAGSCLLTFDLTNTSGQALTDFRLTVALRGDGDKTINFLKDLDFGQISQTQSKVVQFTLDTIACKDVKGIVVSDTVCQAVGGEKQGCTVPPDYGSNVTMTFGTK